jgi:hypothetical protein
MRTFSHKEDEVLVHAATWMNPENIMLNEEASYPHTCNPSYTEAEIRRFEASPGK